MGLSKSILSVFVLFLTSGLLLMGSVAARSQEHIPRGDAYFGFSRTGNDTFYSNVGGLNGWEGELFLKVHKPFLGIEADVSHFGLGANSSVPRTTTFMAGPKIAVRVLGPKVFAHAIGGLEHSANSGGPTPLSADALVFALGGGVDFPFAPFFSWRVEGDYIKAPSLDPRGVSPSTPSRFSTGLVFRF